jgi:hypothetical protein
MKALQFTYDEAEKAAEEWGFNCGPAAIAAICGLSIAALRPNLGDFESKRYTNPTLMFQILERLGVNYQSRMGTPPAACQWPNYGLARIQWEGPWMQPGVPMAARYRYTHWVGCYMAGAGNVGVFEVNCLNNGTGWVSLANWMQITVPFIVRACHPRAYGSWHITHAIEVAG